MAEFQYARLKLFRDRPYYASILWALKDKATAEIPTLAVDFNGNIIYNPEYLTALSMPESVAALSHECLHIGLRHRQRGVAMGVDYETHSEQAAIDRRLWNIAGDIEINQMIVEDGLPVKPEWMMPSTFGFPANLNAESYYQLLKQEADSAMAQAKGKGGAGAGDCGSCAVKGPGESGQSGKPDNGNADKPGDGDGALSDIDRELMAKQFASAAQAHAQGRGTIPGGLRQYADKALMPPRVPWYRQLPQAIRENVDRTRGNGEYDYQRPGRRQWAMWDQSLSDGPMLPNTHDPVIRVALVIDTSGSMGSANGPTLKRVRSEAEGIIRAVGAGVIAISVDAKVSAVNEIDTARGMDMSGGGGTDMIVGIEHAYKMKPRPACCIVLTDGDTLWPANAYHGMKVIACIIGNPYQMPPSWIKTIMVEE